MKRIGVREFKENFALYVKDLPFVVFKQVANPTGPGYKYQDLFMAVKVPEGDSVEEVPFQLWHRFVKTFSKKPESDRENVCVVYNKKEYNWNQIYAYGSRSNPIALKLLEAADALDILDIV